MDISQWLAQSLPLHTVYVSKHVVCSTTQKKFCDGHVLGACYCKLLMHAYIVSVYG